MTGVKEIQKLVHAYLLILWMLIPADFTLLDYPISLWGLYLLLLLGSMSTVTFQKRQPFLRSYIPILLLTGIYALVFGGNLPNVTLGMMIFLGTVLYWVTQGQPVKSKRLRYLCLVEGFIILGIVYVNLFTELGIHLWNTAFYEDPAAVSSYAFFIMYLSAVLYVTDQSRRRWFAFAMSLISTECLFLYAYPGFIISGALLMTAMPLFMPATEINVTRMMQLIFAYFFLLANQSLMAYLPGFERWREIYNLEQSVYLEMVLALAGLWFFKHWDRCIHKTEEEMLPWLRRGSIVACTVILIITVYEYSNRITDLIYVQMKSVYGVYGVVALIIGCALLMERVMNKYYLGISARPMDGIYGCALLVQLLFTPIRIQTLFLTLVLAAPVFRQRIVRNRVKEATSESGLEFEEVSEITQTKDKEKEGSLT